MVATKFAAVIFALTLHITQSSHDYSDLDEYWQSILTLPPGFSISTYFFDSTIVARARQLASTLYRNHTIVYVGTSQTGRPVMALVDIDHDGQVDYSKAVLPNNATSVGAFNSILVDPVQENYVYFMTHSEATLCYNAHDFVLNASNELNCSVFIEFPSVIREQGHNKHHGVFSKDGQYLYLPHGDCDQCYKNKSMDTYPSGVIRRYNMTLLRTYSHHMLPIIHNDSATSVIVAYGMRNSVGMDTHPITAQLWWTDMGANYLGEQPVKYNVDCELNVIENTTADSEFGGKVPHFGFPCFHSKGVGNPFQREINKVEAVKDPWYDYQCLDESEYEFARQPLGPRSSPLGTVFYDRSEYDEEHSNNVIFPERYKNSLFVVLHGCADNEAYINELNYIIGYKVIVIDLNEDNSIANMQDFLTGWRIEGNSSVANNKILNPWIGRPAFIEILNDGSMLLSDDWNSMIYRIVYSGDSVRDTQGIWSNPHFRIALYSASALFCVLVVMCIYCRCIKKQSEEKYQLLHKGKKQETGPMTEL